MRLLQSYLLPYYNKNKEKFIMRLKDNLKELRKKAGYTQEELARKMHVRQYNISDYEIGRIEPNIQALIRFADVFHVSVDYLIGRREKDTKTNYEKMNQAEDPYIDIIKAEIEGLNEEQKKKLVETIRFLIDKYE